MDKNLHSITDEQYTKIVEQIRNLYLELRKNLKEISKIISTLPHQRIKQLKRDLGRLLTMEHLDRLAMYSREKCPEWLALPDRSYPANKLRLFSNNSLKKIWDGEQVVQILCVNGGKSGYKTKKLIECNPLELLQVLDPDIGILGESDQISRLLKSNKSTKQYNEDNADEFDGVLPSKTPGYIIIFGRDKESKPGTRTSAIRIKLDSYRRIKGEI